MIHGLDYTLHSPYGVIFNSKNYGIFKTANTYYVNATLIGISTYRHPSASELLRQSAYNNGLIINEEITDPLPSFVRSGNTYFHQKSFMQMRW